VPKDATATEPDRLTEPVLKKQRAYRRVGLTLLALLRRVGECVGYHVDRDLSGRDEAGSSDPLGVLGAP
jgi:hypothetical protein